MDNVIDPGFDSIRTGTSSAISTEIDQKTRNNILWYSREDPDVIVARMAALDKEWDLERHLELNVSLLSFAGVVLGISKNRLWFMVPAVLAFFLGQHAVQGWSPPVELLRRIGIRTRKEIDMEKYSLMEALKSKQK